MTILSISTIFSLLIGRETTMFCKFCQLFLIKNIINDFTKIVLDKMFFDGYRRPNIVEAHGHTPWHPTERPSGATSRPNAGAFIHPGKSRGGLLLPGLKGTT